jgi:hypothetical protein
MDPGRSRPHQRPANGRGKSGFGAAPQSRWASGRRSGDRLPARRGVDPCYLASNLQAARPPRCHRKGRGQESLQDDKLSRTRRKRHPANIVWSAVRPPGRWPRLDDRIPGHEGAVRRAEVVRSCRGRHRGAPVEPALGRVRRPRADLICSISASHTRDPVLPTGGSVGGQRVVAESRSVSGTRRRRRVLADQHWEGQLRPPVPSRVPSAA